MVSARLSSLLLPTRKVRIGRALRSRTAFLLGAALAGLLQGLALAAYGPFQDSDIYYGLFQEVTEGGFWTTLTDYATQTGKFEPLAVLIFWVESLFIATPSDPGTFLVINMVLLNLLVAGTVGRRLLPHGAPLLAFLVPLVCLSSYFVFSKQLYFWRSALSFCFFMAAVGAVGPRRLLWALLSLLAHYSAAAFLGFYAAQRILSRSRRPVLYQAVFAGVVVFATVFADQLSLLTFFVSGGDLDVFLVPGAHGFRLWLAIFACLIVALLAWRRAWQDESFRPLLTFSFVLLLVSLANFENYHLMQRLSLPAFFIVPFIPFAYPWRGAGLLAARWGIALSVLPTLRLWHMLLTGQFSPS